MPHSNASIVLDMDMLARVFNLNLFFAYEKVFVVLLCLWWGRGVHPREYLASHATARSSYLTNSLTCY